MEHSPRVKHQAADALPKISIEREDKEPVENEVQCLLLSSEPELDDAPTVATVYYDGRKETVLVDWPLNEPVGMRLPAVMKIST